jgi:hydrogenase nickel incorporation protein HypA/HybF
MHETALMQGLISILVRVAADRGLKHISKVTLSVGKFSNALPAALIFAFRTLTHDGIMKGAGLEILNMPAVARCGGCRGEYEIKGFPVVCPACGSTGYLLISGEEVYIKSIECGEE